jgi:hypothetical protein
MQSKITSGFQTKQEGQNSCEFGRKSSARPTVLSTGFFHAVPQFWQICPYKYAQELVSRNPVGTSLDFFSFFSRKFVVNTRRYV